MSSNEPKNPVTTVAILAAHEPDLDPRIDWIAGFTPGNVKSVVFGMFDVRRERKQQEIRRSRYQILRFHRGRSHKKESVQWLFGLIKSRNKTDYYKMMFLFTFGAALECPAMLLWVPVVVIRRSVHFFEDKALQWMFYPADPKKYSVLRSVYLGIRRPFRAVLHQLWLIRQKYQFRPNRLLIVMDVAQYFFSTTKVLVEAVVASPEKFDVIHANDLETLFAGVELKRRLGKKLVFDAHEFWPHSDVAARWWEIRFWEIVERNLVQEVDRAFTVSEQLAEIMGDRYGKKFGSLPNSEPYDGYSQRALSTELRSGTNFVFQGGFAERRGIEFLLKAWAKADLKDCKLILRGPDSDAKAICVKIAKKLGVFDKSVVFAASVDETELLKSLKGCDVGIIPYEPYGINYRYCCPNKLSQYMKCGLAVLHNNLPYVNQIVTDARAGWQYDSRNMVATVKLLRSIAGDREMTAKYGANGEQYFNQRYNWQAVSNELYGSYQL